MPKKVFRVVYAINYILQAAFSMLCPAGLLILGGWYLNYRCGWGKWVLITAIILGVLVGFYCMIYFIMKTMNHIDPTDTKGGNADARKSE